MNTTARALTALAAALALAGCAGSAADEVATDPAAGTNRPGATEPADPSPPAGEEAPPPAEAPAPLPAAVAFGETWQYDDGLEVTVGPPVPYAPTEYAVGHEGKAHVLAFAVTLVNGTGLPFDPSMFTATVQGGNTQGTEVWDDDELQGAPTTTLLAGREAVFTIAFGVDTADDLVLEAFPSWDHEGAIFATNP